MKRRDFPAVLAGGTAGTLTMNGLSHAASKQSKPIRMHVGCQNRSADSVKDMQFLKRHGVDHMCGSEPEYLPDGGWNRDIVARMKDISSREGVSLDMLPLPLSSTGIDVARYPNILLGKSPERDREIEIICRIIRDAAEMEIPALKYNMTILPVLRTAYTPGRGGSTYSTWRYADAPKDAPLTKAGVVDLDTFFERIAYFIERVIPAAEEHKVRLACHIADPGTVPGYRGIDRALGTVDGLKRFMNLSKSPYHGMNFCIGSAAEQLNNPGVEIYDVLRFFCEQGRVFHVHFRNISGKRDDFREVYPDNGDLDMIRLMRVLRDTSYQYMVCPDHMPSHPDDRDGKQAFAFGYGYIIALIQAVSSET